MPTCSVESRHSEGRAGGGVRISCAQPYLVIYRTQTFASLQNRDTKHVEALPIRLREVPRRDIMGGERFGCTLALWPEYTISDPIFHERIKTT